MMAGHSDDIRSDWQRLVDEGLLPNPNQAMLNPVRGIVEPDPRLHLYVSAINDLASEVMSLRGDYFDLHRRLGSIDRQLMRAQNLLRYIHREGVGALGDHEDEAFEYAIGDDL